MTNVPSESPAPGGMRASDADRERVAEALREAAAEGRLDLEELDQRLDQVFSAKTYAELAPITADIPSPGTTPLPAVPRRPESFGIERHGGAPENLALGIMGGFIRKGEWDVPPELSAVAIMGGGEIDLREARFTQGAVTIHVVAIMGGVQITVPEDADVQVNGIGIMGGFDHSAAGGGSPGGPRIVINGVAFWGGVALQRKPADLERAPLDTRRTGELGS
jgi:Domain of unknown function (DUF1707)/Cell wall-active antibiotics response 4TMS YvqF